MWKLECYNGWKLYPYCEWMPATHLKSWATKTVKVVRYWMKTPGGMNEVSWQQVIRDRVWDYPEVESHYSKDGEGVTTAWKTALAKRVAIQECFSIGNYRE